MLRKQFITITSVVSLTASRRFRNTVINALECICTELPIHVDNISIHHVQLLLIVNLLVMSNIVITVGFVELCAKILQIMRNHLKIMRALFPNYAHLFGFVLHTIGNQQ